MEDNHIDESTLHDLTYSEPRFEAFMLDDNLPAEKSPDDAMIRKIPEADLGTLSVLPLELLHATLSLPNVDILSLTNFYRVNRHCMEIVENLPVYKAVKKHASSALRGLLIIRMASWFTCNDLYTTLCTSSCEQCGNFGSYIYLLTCSRVCFLCFTKRKRYLPHSRDWAILNYGLNDDILDTLPVMRSVKGTYSMKKIKESKRFKLVDHSVAYNAGIKRHGSADAMQHYVSHDRNTDWNAYIERHRRDPSTARFRFRETRDNFDALAQNVFRFMAIVRMPSLDSVSKELEWGFYCIGCADSNTKWLIRNSRKFTIHTFGEHLKKFGEIKDGKHVVE